MRKHVLSLSLAGLPCLFAGSAQAELLVYEGFNYAVGDAAGNSGGLGLTGGWSTSTNTGGERVEIADGTDPNHLWDGVFTNANVTQTGLHAGGSRDLDSFADHVYLNRKLASSVTDSFTDGATTWISYIHAASDDANANRATLALSSSTTIASTGGPGGSSRGRTSDVDAIGFGGAFNDDNVRALTWDIGGATQVNQVGGSPIATITSPQFVIAKIVWSDSGDDTVTVARFGEGDTITEAAFDSAPQSTASIDLDQSQLDTLGMAGTRYYVDEIRIATTFEDAVSGVPEPGSLALLGLGGLCVLRRRRS
ncbi:MAG: PEP-CTERM sorting domain-containing protein [Planctomycetota bacterium]